MKAIYLDASAFVKLIVSEPESSALRRYLKSSAPGLVSSALIQTETIRAVRHLGASGIRGAREALGRLDLIAIDDRVLDAAGLIEPRTVRTLDAIHLATALSLGRDLEAITTYDRRMIEGARMLGLPTATPGRN